MKQLFEMKKIEIIIIILIVSKLLVCDFKTTNRPIVEIFPP